MNPTPPPPPPPHPPMPPIPPGTSHSQGDHGRTPAQPGQFATTAQTAGRGLADFVRKNKVLSIIVASAFLILFVCCGGPLILMGIGGAAQEQEKEEKSARIDKEKPIVVSAAQLYSEFNDNEPRAKRQFVGKVVQVSGSVGQISERHVMLEGDRLGLAGVYCYLRDEDVEAVESLSKGNYVTLVGICEGKSVVSVEVKNCRFVE